MRGEPPLGERNFGALEHGAHGRGALPTAFVAVVEARAMGLLFAFDLGNALRVGVAAVRAVGTIRPPRGFKSFAGCGLVVEDGVLQVGHGYLLWPCILATHPLLSSI